MLFWVETNLCSICLLDIPFLCFYKNLETRHSHSLKTNYSTLHLNVSTVFMCKAVTVTVETHHACLWIGQLIQLLLPINYWWIQAYCCSWMSVMIIQIQLKGYLAFIVYSLLPNDTMWWCMLLWWICHVSMITNFVNTWIHEYGNTLFLYTVTGHIHC